MTALLTPEQVAELERGGSSTLLVEDPKNHRGYVLVPSEAFEQARPLLEALIAKTRGESADADEWNEQKNARRCELIDKKHDGNLSGSELAELHSLQSELADHQRRIAPRPLAILELIEAGLRQRAAAPHQAE